MSTLRFAATAVTAATVVTAMRYFGTTMQQNKPKEPNYIEEFEDRDDTKELEQTALISDKIIFIPKIFTEKAMNNNYILERFESDKQLFYYLRWRSNMELIHGNLKIYFGTILIFCTDLHCKKNCELLYVIGIKNDKATININNKRIEKWKMDEYFMNALEIKKKYGLHRNDLPIGSQTILNKKYKNNIDLNQLINTKNKISIDTYTELPIIKTNKVKSDKTKSNQLISKQQLISEIRNSEIFIPIISFNENKTKYYIDMVLLLLINQNWICIIFSEKNNYYPIGLGVDCIDMKNKMNLFKAATNDKQYKWIENNIACLRIYSEKQVKQHDNQHAITGDLMREIQILREKNQQQSNIIQCLCKRNNELSDINNWYFQQIFDRNSNIKPHSVHLVDSAKAQYFLYNNNINIQ